MYMEQCCLPQLGQDCGSSGHVSHAWKQQACSMLDSQSDATRCPRLQTVLVPTNWQCISLCKCCYSRRHTCVPVTQPASSAAVAENPADCSATKYSVAAIATAASMIRCSMMHAHMTAQVSLPAVKDIHNVKVKRFGCNACRGARACAVTFACIFSIMRSLH